MSVSWILSGRVNSSSTRWINKLWFASSGIFSVEMIDRFLGVNTASLWGGNHCGLEYAHVNFHDRDSRRLHGYFCFCLLGLWGALQGFEFPSPSLLLSLIPANLEDSHPVSSVCALCVCALVSDHLGVIEEGREHTSYFKCIPPVGAIGAMEANWGKLLVFAIFLSWTVGLHLIVP